MIIASSAVIVQVVLVLLVGIIGGIGKVRTDADGNLDLSCMPNTNSCTVKLLIVARYVAMVMLYAGFTAVVIGVFLMKGPKEIWKDEKLPVSPAVKCTILLTTSFFLIYLLAAVAKTCLEISPSLRTSQAWLKLQAGAASAQLAVNVAPMLCILFIGVRMRALQIDPKHGNPQSWAQNCFYLCTFSVMIQAGLVFVMPFMARTWDSEDKVPYAMTVARYLCLLALYVGITVVIYSIFVIQHPAGHAKTPPVPPAVRCVITLTAQYFVIYTLLYICATLRYFAPMQGTGDAEQVARASDKNSAVARSLAKASAILDAARGTVMFAPMLCILFIGVRMRAMQLAKAEDGTIPLNAGPPIWVQDAMYLATWATFLQLVMVMLVPILTGAVPECDKDGNAKVPPDTYKALVVSVDIFRYISLLFMYGGAMVVVYGIFTMTPESLPPYSMETLMPGVEVPKPPVPASVNTYRSAGAWR